MSFDYITLLGLSIPTEFELKARSYSVIRDCDIIVRNSIVIQEFQPDLKFLANRVCFDYL